MFAIHSLYARLLLILIAVLVPALSGAIIYTVHSEREMLENQMRARGQAIARTLATASEDAAVSNDYPALEGNAEAATRCDPEIAVVRFSLLNSKRILQYPHDEPVSTCVLAKHEIRPGSRVVGEVEVGISTDVTLSEIARRRLLGVLAMSVIFILMAVTLLLVLNRAVVRPVRRLTAVVARIEAGDYTGNSEVEGRGEVGQLAAGLDRMAAALLARDLEIRKAHNELAAQNQELQHKSVEVARKNEELREANRVKDEFLATMSHELRTPLNGVLGYLSLLKECLYTSLDEQRSFLESAFVSGSQLLKLVNDLLDFSRMQAGDLTVRCERIDVVGIVNEVLAEQGPRATAKGLRVRSHLAPDLPSAMGDAGRTRQVLCHLFDNAIKFTHEGEISIDVEHIPEREVIQFAITDTGIGMTEEFLDRAFEMFLQADGSYTRRYGGVGLGLCLSKRVINLMGGEIWIHSAGPGFGSTVSFSLPCAPAPVPARKAQLEVPTEAGPAT
jgi:two-component system sensor histidine kinase BarA